MLVRALDHVCVDMQKGITIEGEEHGCAVFNGPARTLLEFNATVNISKVDVTNGRAIGGMFNLLMLICTTYCYREHSNAC